MVYPSTILCRFTAGTVGTLYSSPVYTDCRRTTGAVGRVYALCRCSLRII